MFGPHLNDKDDLAYPVGDDEKQKPGQRIISKYCASRGTRARYGRGLDDDGCLSGRRAFRVDIAFLRTAPIGSFSGDMVRDGWLDAVAPIPCAIPAGIG